MTIQHHIPDDLLLDYAAGRLPAPFALVVAAHVSLNDDARARLGAHEAVGGALIDAEVETPLSEDLRENVLSQLDGALPETPVYQRSGIFPAPVMEALKGQPPKWKRLGGGVRQMILSEGKSGSVRLLYIPGGRPVPDHTHGGLELTLVLQGAFSDETGTYAAGDLEVADDNLHHQPIATKGQACICLAATDAPLRFGALVPRLLQPLFRI